MFRQLNSLCRDFKIYMVVLAYRIYTYSASIGYRTQFCIVRYRTNYGIVPALSGTLCKTEKKTRQDIHKKAKLLLYVIVTLKLCVHMEQVHNILLSSFDFNRFDVATGKYLDPIFFQHWAQIEDL